MSSLVKQSFVIVLAGIVMLFFVARLVHRRRLSFGFASGWVAVSVAVIASSLLTPLVNPVARQFEMTGTAVFLVVAVAFIVGVCIQLSISVSGLQDRIRDLAEANALLREELERREPGAEAT